MPIQNQVNVRRTHGEGRHPRKKKNHSSVAAHRTRREVSMARLRRHEITTRGAVVPPVCFHLARLRWLRILDGWLPASSTRAWPVPCCMSPSLGLNKVPGGMSRNTVLGGADVDANICRCTFRASHGDVVVAAWRRKSVSAYCAGLLSYCTHAMMSPVCRPLRPSNCGVG